MSVQHIQNSVNDVIAYLTENPQDALGTSPPVTAVMEKSLRCRATGGAGQSIVKDMPQAVGGGGAAPSPGWLARAAIATCDATRIALRAAEIGIELDALEVVMDSVDDDRGLFGIDKSVRAGSLSIRTLRRRLHLRSGTIQSRGHPAYRTRLPLPLVPAANRGITRAERII